MGQGSDLTGWVTTAGLLALIVAGEALAGRIGEWMRWREQGPGGALPWSWAAVAIGATCVAAVVASLPIDAGPRAGAGMAIAWYMATLDMKERWVPDHGILLLVFGGLELSPMASLQDRVNGAVVCGALALTLLVARTYRSRAALGWEGMSGGDVWFPIGMGAWLGVTQGILALACYVLLETMATMTLVMNRPGDGRMVRPIERLLRYDRTTDSIPAVPYMAAGLCVGFCTAPLLGR